MGKVDFNVGEFTTKISVLKQSRKRSSSGEVIKDYEECLQVFAKVEDKTVNENGIESIVLVRLVEITTYWHNEITNSARLGIWGDVYEILSVSPVGNRWVKIVAKLM